MIYDWQTNGDLPSPLFARRGPELFATSTTSQRRSQGELFPAQPPEGATGRAFVEFFQTNRLTGEPKAVLAVGLKRGAK
jgi:hypothetical protein